MDLIHPMDKLGLVDEIRRANTDRTRLLVVGGRTHMDKGNPCEVDAELWTTQLDSLIAYEPAEMIVVVEAGMRVDDLDRILAEGQQEWAADAPPGATVGGVIASASSSPRRLKLGHVRDTVIEMELVTGDGRLIKSGARTVKNVTGYDIHKLMAGSLGTLGVIVQVALKVRPRPRARRTVWVPGGLEAGMRLLDAVPGPAAIMATPGAVELRLEGWPGEVEHQLRAAGDLAPVRVVDEDEPFPSERPWEASAAVAEAAVPPSRLPELFTAPFPEPLGSRPLTWGALVGVGVAWVGLASPDGELDAVRSRTRALGGIAPVIRGPGGLGDDVPSGMEIHGRLKAALDPAGIMAPGRFWGGL